MKNHKIILACFFTLIGNQAAQAAGLQASFDNASSLGLANAGSAVLAENATTVSLNPAGMFNLEEKEFSLGAISINRKVKLSDRDSSAGAFNNTGGTAGGDQKFLYNFYATYALNSDFRVGVGVKQPYKREDNMPNPWQGSAQQQNVNLNSTEVTPTIAYKISDKTSIGGGANWQQLDLRYTRAASTLTAFSLNKDAVSFDGSGNGWGWNAGLRHEFSPEIKVGLTYKSPIKYKLNGDVYASGPTSALLAAYNNKSAYMEFISPAAWTFSASGQISDNFTLLGDISLTKWGAAGASEVVLESGATFDQGLKANLKDSYRAAIGGLYALNSKLDLKIGYAIEQSPVKYNNTRVTSLPDGNTQWLSAGARVKIKSSRVDFGVAYALKNSSRVVSDKRSSNQGLVSGQFNVNTWVAGVQLSQGF